MRKKLVSLLTLGALTSQLLAPNLVYATDAATKITQEQAMSLVKSTFNINDKGASVDIGFREDDYRDRDVWDFNWNYSRYGQWHYIHSEVDAETGEIIGYSEDQELSAPAQSKRKTKDECAKLAQAYLQKLAPKHAQQVKLMDTPGYMGYGAGPVESYYYIRQVNGIDFPEDSISLTIDAYTGKIKSYGMNWHDDLVFPKADQVVPEAEATKLLQDNLELQLTYGGYWGYYESRFLLSDKPVPLYYTPWSPGFSGALVEASTGKLIDITGEAVKVQEQVYFEPKPEPIFNEDNKKEIPMEQLIAQVESQVSIPTGFKLVSRRMNEGWGPAGRKVWNFQYSPNNNYGPENLDIAVDAFTGEIISYHNWDGGDPWQMPEGKKPTITFEQAEKMAEAFVKSVAPTKEGYYYIPPSEEPGGYYVNNQKTEQRVYNFHYTRIVNGILHNSNGLDIEVDNLKGRVVSYYQNWDNQAKFANPTGIISKEEAKAKYLENRKVKLVYMRKAEKQFQSTDEVMLVYVFDETGAPQVIDATTGKVIKNEPKEPTYFVDVRGHWAEQAIMSLSYQGIIKGSGDKFYPNKQMTRAEFITMMVQAKGLDLTDEESKKFADVPATAWYYKAIQAAVKDGMVKGAGDKFYPNRSITRQEIAVMLMQALPEAKRPEVTTIPDTFKDRDKVATWARPAVAQAIEMGIINSQQTLIKPTQPATKAEAAQMLLRLVEQSYRYMY